MSTKRGREEGPKEQEEQEEPEVQRQRTSETADETEDMDVTNAPAASAASPTRTNPTLEEMKKRTEAAPGRSRGSILAPGGIEDKQRQKTLQKQQEQDKTKQEEMFVAAQKCPPKYQKLAKILALSTMVFGICTTLRWTYSTAGFVVNSPGLQKTIGMIETTANAASATGSAAASAASATGSAAASALSTVDKFTGVTGTVKAVGSAAASSCNAAITGAKDAIVNITPRLSNIISDFLYHAGPPLAVAYAAKNPEVVIKIQNRINKLTSLRTSERREADIAALTEELEKMKVGDKKESEKQEGESLKSRASAAVASVSTTLSGAKDVLTGNTLKLYETLFRLWCRVLEEMDETIIQKLLDPLSMGRLGAISGGKSRRHHKNKRGKKTRKVHKSHKKAKRKSLKSKRHNRRKTQKRHR